MFLQLDSGNAQNCSGRTLTYVNLLDGSHSFDVAVNTSSGLQFSSVYTWSVGKKHIYMPLLPWSPPCLFYFSNLTRNPHYTNSLNFGFFFSTTKPLNLMCLMILLIWKVYHLALSIYKVVCVSADTVPPTAKLTTAELFTNAVNITVFINFTESCSGQGGFQCSNISSCDVSYWPP